MNALEQILQTGLFTIFLLLEVGAGLLILMGILALLKWAKEHLLGLSDDGGAIYFSNDGEVISQPDIDELPPTPSSTARVKQELFETGREKGEWLSGRRATRDASTEDDLSVLDQPITDESIHHGPFPPDAPKTGRFKTGADYVNETLANMPKCEDTKGAEPSAPEAGMHDFKSYTPGYIMHYGVCVASFAMNPDKEEDLVNYGKLHGELWSITPHTHLQIHSDGTQGKIYAYDHIDEVQQVCINSPLEMIIGLNRKTLGVS